MWNPWSDQSKSSSSTKVDFLDLCIKNVRSIEDLVNGENLLNKRQCLDLSSKLSKTILNIRELVLHCGASAVLLRPALEDLYRYLEKAKLLVRKCREDDWCAAAVFQIQNENDFRELLLDVSLCYNVIYELAKSTSEDGNVRPEDLRETLVFQSATDSDIHEDQQYLQKRLEVLANEPSNCSNSLLDRFLLGKEAVKQCLARYLLLKLNYTSEQSETNISDTFSAILWSKESEPSGTWGNCRYLGAGSGASCVCSTKWLGIPCAKKEFHGQEYEGSFLKEANILAQLKHPRIVNFICCGVGSEMGHHFIAMELMEMSLSKLIKDQKNVRFSLHVAVDMMVQIARGMCYLHDQHVAHRDLKPENVVVNKLTYPHLVDHFCIKVVDFGMSKTKVEVSKDNTISVSGVGTTRYRAPEVHPKAQSTKVSWFKADVFSFAVTCAYLLSLKIPFGESQQLSGIYKDLKNGRRPELPEDCPQELVALLKKCWDTDPFSRPPFMEICSRLEQFRHKFLRGDQEEIMDFRKGFGFIETELKKHSSIQKPLVGYTDTDEAESETSDSQGNNRIDVVSTIPCTCGRALEFIPQCPYPGPFRCNVCGEKDTGGAYHCETCQYDAQSHCVEIKDKVKVFFHDDPLHLLAQYYCRNNPDAVCGFCAESLQESEWVYRCDECDFDVHALCTKYPKKLKHTLHPHDLTLVQPHLRKSWFCKCCNCNIRGYRYKCTQKWCIFDLHLSCAILLEDPLCIFDIRHRLSLGNFEKGFYCGRCGTLGFSWFYRCNHCDVDIHLDCVDDIDDHTKMDTIFELLDKFFVSDTLESSSSSSSRPPLVRVQPTIQRLTLAERPSLDAFDDVNLRKKIVAETVERKAKKMATREARQKLKAESLEMLENLENIVLDLQSSKNTSQADTEILAAELKKLKERRDILREEEAMQVLSKVRQGPRIGLFYKQNVDTKRNEVLTSLRADMEAVPFALLCEEPDHEHIVLKKCIFDVIGERILEKLQPMLPSGLQVVTRAISTLAAQPTGLDSVMIPTLGEELWDLRAIDLKKPGNQSRNILEDKALKKAGDFAAEWLLRYFEEFGCDIFKTFGLLRVHYTVTEEANSPRYTQGSLAWLCTDHLTRGLEAGTLKSYPLRMYHNVEYDEQLQ